MIIRTEHSRFIRYGWQSSCICGVVALSAGTTYSQDRQLDYGDYEYEPGEGIHEEEWYDPTDWFDDDTTIAWEPDWDWDYDDERYGYHWYDYDDYYWWDDHWDYGWYYDELSDDWRYGGHYEDDYVLDWAAERDFGWYYDEDANEWRYGWHPDRETGSRRGTQQTRSQQPLQGEIVQLYTDDFQGQNQLFARIQTDRGRTVRVKLGPQQRLRSLSLREGDQVTVAGQRRDFNGAPLVVANRIVANGKTVRLTGPREARAHTRQLEGTIERVFPKNVGAKTHLWAEIRSDSGRRVTADLGPRTQFRGTGLQQGDDITILGERGRMQGRSVLVADRVRINDETIQVSRQKGSSARTARTASHGGEPSISGTVADTFWMEKNGSTHFGVLVRTKDGRRVRADLGPQRGLSDLDLNRGDRVQLSGSFQQHRGGTRMFLADQIRAAGQTIQLRPLNRQFQRTRDERTDSRQYRSRRGELMNVWVQQMQGFRRPQIIGEVQFEGGETKQVVLGAQDALQDANLAAGDQVVLLTTSRPNVPYAVATTVYLDGREFKTHQ